VYDDATRAKARTIAEARGIAAASTVCGIGETTLRRWANADGWRTGHHAPPADTPVPRPVAAAEKGNADHSTVPRPRDPAWELQADAELARRVFRAQGNAVLDGHGRPQWFKDSAIALGIAVDKYAAHGSPTARNPGQPGLSPEQQRARREARILRLIEICEQVEHRNGNGDG
jgi:hypothetical protein